MSVKKDKIQSIFYELLNNSNRKGPNKKLLQMIDEAKVEDLETVVAGNTLLHVATEKGCVDVVDKLLAKHPQLLTKRDRNGWLPAHTAAYYGSFAVLQRFLQINKQVLFDLTIKDESLLTVAKSNPMNSIHMIAFLEQQEANTKHHQQLQQQQEIQRRQTIEKEPEPNVNQTAAEPQEERPSEPPFDSPNSSSIAHRRRFSSLLTFWKRISERKKSPR